LVIVESHEEWKKFIKEFGKYNSIVIPIQCDENKHPLDTELCLLYVKLLDGNLEEYVLPFRHSDAINLKDRYIKKTWTLKDVFTYDKKKLLHFVKWENITDMQMHYYMSKNEPLPIDEITTNAHEYFYRTHYKTKNINCVIPIMKHIEWCRKLVDHLKVTVFVKPGSKSVLKIYNDDVIGNLQYIEKSGLQTTNGMVYSEYNPYTATGRPSNRFGGMNFAALNKSDGSRKQFVSRFGKDGMLVEMDYDAYHLRLIGDVVDYKFPKGSVHEHMAKLYKVDYNEAKSLSFQYLYGHIPDDVLKKNPFFKKVQVYIDEIWDQYKSSNSIKSDIYNKRIRKENLSDMNKNKVFNYLIQLTETESNMRMLTELIPKLEAYKSKLVLYSYDSFLFDFYMPDGLKFLHKVKKIIEQNGKFPVKVGKGWNYHEMKDITRKFK
jgi:hypothetical protein